MHARPASEFVIYGTFWILALAFVLRILAAVYYYHRSGRGQAPRRNPVGRKPPPKWLTSGITGLLLVAGCAVLGMATALAARQWRVNAAGVRDQRTLSLDLHIPHVMPNQTYTVIAKFHLRGRQYVSAPLRVQFGPQKPVYHLLLYYDPRRPQRNGWAKLRADARDLERMAADAIAWMLLSILLLEWLQFARARTYNSDSAGTSEGLQL